MRIKGFSFINNNPSEDYVNSIKNNINMPTYEIIATKKDAKYEYLVWTVESGYFNCAILAEILEKIDGEYDSYILPSLRQMDSSTIEYCSKGVHILKKIPISESKIFKRIECDWLFYEEEI